MEQQYLLRIGLIRLERDRFKVANQIYRNIFDRVWVKNCLEAQLSIEHEQHSANLSLKISKDVKSNFLQLARVVLFLALMGGAIKLGLSLTTKYERVQQIRQANRLLDRQEYSAAISAYDSLLQTDIEKPHLLWINRGYAWSGLQEYREMLQSCSTATQIEPQAAFAWNCRGEALYHLEQYDAARQALERAISLYPQSAFWLNQSKVLEQLQQPDLALAANERAIELLLKLSPKSSAERRNLAIAFERQGQNLLQSLENRAALAAFEQSLKYLANYHSAMQGKAITLYRLGEYEEAIAVWEQILSQNDLTSEQKAIGWLYSGISLCQIKNITAARQAFRRVLQLTTDSQARTIAEAGCGIQ